MSGPAQSAPIDLKPAPKSFTPRMKKYRQTTRATNSQAVRKREARFSGSHWSTMSDIMSVAARFQANSPHEPPMPFVLDGKSR